MTRRSIRWAVTGFFGAVAPLLCLFLADPAHALMTPAGTDISNIAHVRFDLDGVRSIRDSNMVHTRVDEELAATLEPMRSGTLAAPSGTGDVVVGFVLTNTGNGNEAFVPTVTHNGGLFHVRIVADSTGNDMYDPGVDQTIADGGATPVLGPGHHIDLFVVGELPAGGANGVVSMTVTPAAGTGPVGTLLSGKGDGGGDAVVGSIDGSASAAIPIDSGQLVASLVKSQTVLAPDGSAKPVRGATIIYRIEGSFSGTGVASGVVINDLIPDGTTYVPGSLTLDDVAVTDAVDGDTGAFDGKTISVSLDRVAAPAAHVVTFKVRIN